MASILNSAEHPNRVIFHLVACGRDLEAAKILQRQVTAAIGACLPSAKYHLIPFSLPVDSGFALQLAAAKKRSHWISSSGADMVRFYLASLFPKVRRILYLDNDVVVSCCIEEVYWKTDMSRPDKIVGIALDDLQWATITQFRFHYNASHPLVVQNIRRNSSAGLTGAVSEKEFHQALPRYPNDGVLLIDVQRYNAAKVQHSCDGNGNGYGNEVQ